MALADELPGVLAADGAAGAAARNSLMVFLGSGIQWNDVAC